MYFKEEFEKEVGKYDTHRELVLASMKALDEGNGKVKGLRQKSKSATFAANYMAQPPKIAETVGCTLEEAEKLFNRYHNELYPEITDYRENYVFPTIKEYGEIHLGLGYMLKSKYNSEDIKSTFNATIQFYSIITLITVARVYYHLKDNNLLDRVKIINTIYDSIYLEIDEDLELIKYINELIIPIFTTQIFENEIIPNNAETDIGYDYYNMITISNNASIEEIQSTINKLKE
jgi:hypothetical protein